MPIKISQIKGALIEKKDRYIENYDTTSKHAFNSAIDQQGEVEIGLNREKLAQEFHNMVMREFLISEKNPILMKKHLCANLINCKYEFSDALIAQEKDIIEVKK